MAGPGAGSTLSVNTPIVENFPVAIGTTIKQGNIGNAGAKQTGSSDGQGGTVSMGLSLAGVGLVNLQVDVPGMHFNGPPCPMCNII